MASIFQDNFDSYADGQLTLNSAWSGDSEPIVQGVDYFSAPKAVKMPNVGSEVERSVYHSLDALLVGYIACYIKVVGGSQTDGAIELRDAGLLVFRACFLNDNKIYVNKSGGEEVLQTYEKNRWYRVVIQFDCNVGVKKCRFKINNGSWSSWRDAEDTVTQVDGLYLYGHLIDSDVYFDDVVVSTTEPLPTSEYTSQNWGMEAKSQIDNETIEEAIDRLIAVHTADPEAHLGTSESLQSHKAEAIIDHIAGSVVADKLSASNNFLDIPVNAATDHAAANYTDLNPGFLAEFVQSDPLTGDATDGLVDLSIYDWGYVAGDVCVDIVLWPQGLSGTWLATFETGFSKIEIKASYVRFGYYDGSWHYSDWIAQDNDVPYKFRVRYDSIGGILYFLRDGVVLYSIAYTFTLDGTTLSPLIRLNRGSSSSATVFFGNVKVAFDSLVS